MKGIVLMLAAVLALAACGDKSKRLYFDGKLYPATAKKEEGARELFVVTVRKADQGLDGAREAGRHAGHKYCIENYGTSNIEWSQGPDAEDGTLVFAGGSLILRGKCVVW